MRCICICTLDIWCTTMWDSMRMVWYIYIYTMSKNAPSTSRRDTRLCQRSHGRKNSRRRNQMVRWSRQRRYRTFRKMHSKSLCIFRVWRQCSRSVIQQCSSSLRDLLGHTDQFKLYIYIYIEREREIYIYIYI